MNASDDSHTPREVVDKAMARRRRAGFLPMPQRWRAGDDAPVGLGHGQTNSQPSTVAEMLVLLDVRPGQRVLDLGSGSGWTTAVLGDLVGEDGEVLGVERVPELVERSREALSSHDMEWVSVRQAAVGTLGAPDAGPFDRILVSAEARDLPEELVAQLAADGVMVVPVRGDMVRVVRRGPGSKGRSVTRHGTYRFVPLVQDSE